MSISAEVYSDDQRVKVKFDATAALEELDDNMLFNLARFGWRNCYEADDVAQRAAETNKEVEKVFDYLELVPTMPYSEETQGFECRVDATAALKWVKTNRPAVYAQLQAEKIV